MRSSSRGSGGEARRDADRESWQGGERHDFSLSELAYVVWNRRWLVGGMALAAALATLVVGLARGPVYPAEALVDVDPRGGEPRDPSAFVDEVRVAVVTADFRREAARRAGWEGTPEGFSDRLDPEPFEASDGSGLKVRFFGSAPEESARAANAYATLFVERVDDLGRSRLAGGSLAADAAIEERATPRSFASSPGLLLYAGLAAVAGIILGAAAALLLDDRARLWRGARDAELTLRVPVLGVIPDYSQRPPEGGG